MGGREVHLDGARPDHLSTNSVSVLWRLPEKSLEQVTSVKTLFADEARSADAGLFAVASTDREAIHPLRAEISENENDWMGEKDLSTLIDMMGSKRSEPSCVVQTASPIPSKTSCSYAFWRGENMWSVKIT